MPVPLPDQSSRWRCSSCGNLTRFDVTRTTRVQEYWHVDLGRNASIEQTDVIADNVERVACRWCGARDTVELVPRPDPESAGPDANVTPGGP